VRDIQPPLLICDTGPLVAVLNENDADHLACVELFDSFQGTLVVPSLVVAEVAYLAQTQVNPNTESRFMDSIANGELKVIDLTEDDWVRVAELVRQYKNFPLGATDAAVIALAERFKQQSIASLDTRHMLAVRPRHCAGLTLLP